MTTNFVLRRQIAKLARRKWTADDIARETCVHVATVRRHLKALGLKAKRPQREGPLSDLPTLRRYVRELGVTEAAVMFGVSRQAVYAALKRAG
jgi:DNA-directed RNA polymerase specialized sigma24 family protein